MDKVALGTLQGLLLRCVTTIKVIEKYETFLDLGDFDKTDAALGAVAMIAGEGDEEDSLA